MKPTLEERRQWNPLIVDVETVPAEAKQLPVFKQLAEIKEILPEHELVYRYDWVPAGSNDEIAGCIGQPLNNHMLEQLVGFFGLTEPHKQSVEERGKSLNYWWPVASGKKMIPIGFFNMPASFNEIAAVSFQHDQQHGCRSTFTPYYGYRDMRASARSLSSLRYTTTFFVFGSLRNCWTEPMNQCRVFGKQDLQLSSLLSDRMPELRETRPTAEQLKECVDMVANVILNETDYRQWEAADEEGGWIKPPQHTLAAPHLIVEADCLYEGRFAHRFSRKDDEECWDYAVSGQLTFNQWLNDPRFNTKGSVCQLFGRPASQQEPHRPITPQRHPFISAMIPFLNFSDNDHDMTHQIYADGLRLDYCQDTKAVTYIESSCT